MKRRSVKVEVVKSMGHETIFKSVIFSSDMGNAKVRLSGARPGGHRDLKDNWCVQEKDLFPKREVQCKFYDCGDEA